MLLKVQDGTPKNSASLCSSCRKATITKGHTVTLIDCEALNSENAKQLPYMQPVLSCSEYDDRSIPSLSNMREIAWNLEPNKKTGQLGFHQPKKSGNRIFNPVSGKEEW